MYLNGKKVIYPHVAIIVWKYLEQEKNKIGTIENKLIKNKKIFQFVYSSTYPEVYSFIKKRGIELRNIFHLKFIDWKDKKKYSQKSINSYFLKSENSAPPPGAIQKNLEVIKIFKRKKIGQRTKRIGNVRKKTNKKRTKARNRSKK